MQHREDMSPQNMRRGPSHKSPSKLFNMSSTNQRSSQLSRSKKKFETATKNSTSSKIKMLSSEKKLADPRNHRYAIKEEFKRVKNSGTESYERYYLKFNEVEDYLRCLLYLKGELIIT